MEYGIYDTQDDCWIGSDEGPKTYSDLTTARISAQVLEDQMFGGLGMKLRLEARELPDQSWGLKDELAVQRDALTSLRRIEGGKTQ